MKSLSKLAELFCKDTVLAGVARVLARSDEEHSMQSIVEVSCYSTKVVCDALESLNALKIADKMPDTGSAIRYKLNPSAVDLTTKALACSEEALLRERATKWNIDAKSRLEWVEGLHQMIEAGRQGYHGNIR